MKATWIILGVLAGVPACGKDEPAATGEPGSTTAKAGEMSDAKKSLVEAWKKAGLTPSEMTGSTAFGKDCNAATVNKVDVVVCEFPSDDEAKKAEQPGLDWVGSTTGAAWVSGPLVIAVADRKKADVNGKTINQLMKSTPK
ncbi:MAG: hypothetical protein H0V17_29815 [Deltaproteobacteria bacterium]|nr:hypothetical protein [Deltaproteobacteria bacterium]